MWLRFLEDTERCNKVQSMVSASREVEIRGGGVDYKRFTVVGAGEREAKDGSARGLEGGREDWGGGSRNANDQDLQEMAPNESNTILKENSKTTTDPVRPFANFPPSIWGDRLLSLQWDYSELKAYATAIEEPKEELRRLIINPIMDSNTKLGLINSVDRLGLSYLFGEEIECQLDKLFKELNMEDYDQLDLYTTSINFQVFRQHGYKFPCDVFNKFKDISSGKFKEYVTADVRGMLNLFESTQLRIRGESILDEAFVFTEAQLMGVVLDTLEGNLANQVKHALRSPFHLGMQVVEARLYFSNYKEECSTYESLLKLANTHFNYLQQLHKEELCIFTKWMKDMDFKAITPYARDRTPELYLWAIALFPETHYAQARIIISKVAQLVWEISAMEQFQELARGYLQEAEWRYRRHVPPFQEYLKNGLITSTYNVFTKSSLMGMGEIVTQEVLACLRVKEHKKSVHTYMKSFEVAENVAIYELKKMIENAWKDINEACLKPAEVSMEVLAPILNLARMTDMIYRYNDRFTFPEKTIVEYVTLLFIDYIPMY
ncbi:hypothetical protein L2E82_31194 [Cichorium intybus]|uniref:Uncharacterized protein n=1 Tax=Cichorium intybus TaxID=13427 RepID=A0ACB9D281_CICIN|nr:hypothetical protein L2E82_31194 [Cichorium intybus]